MEPGEAARLANDLRATNALGRPYAGDNACECQNLCEAEPRATADGYFVRVLLQTGGTLDGVQLVAGAALVRWDTERTQAPGTDPARDVAYSITPPQREYDRS